MLGYSDDNIILGPSTKALQDIVNICEKYVDNHVLMFSTDPNPSKSKTKCIAFSRKKETLPDITLCGNVLPWVNKVDHLGTVLTNDGDIVAKDVSVKRAAYIAKNNAIMQEFESYPSLVKIHINEVYNMSLTGSQTWGLFGKKVDSMVNTHNVSMRLMVDAPIDTHRYLVETISGKKHLRWTLLWRFWSFLKQFKKTEKLNFLDTIARDCRSMTGLTLRKILLMTNCGDISELDDKVVKQIIFDEVPTNQDWRVGVLTELTRVNEGSLNQHHFDKSELDMMQAWVCRS